MIGHVYIYNDTTDITASTSPPLLVVATKTTTEVDDENVDKNIQ